MAINGIQYASASEASPLYVSTVMPGGAGPENSAGPLGVRMLAVVLAIVCTGGISSTYDIPPIALQLQDQHLIALA